MILLRFVLYGLGWIASGLFFGILLSAWTGLPLYVLPIAFTTLYVVAFAQEASREPA